MNETRQRIRRYIRLHPGVHFSCLQRALDIGPGQIQHHIERLANEGDAVSEEFYGQTHFYPPEYEPWERRTLALLRRETAGDIVATLFEKPRRPGEVADQLDIARSTLEWHLDRLVESNVVQKERNKQGQVMLRLAQPVETAQLLRQADSSLFERLLDRFTRIVDRLLESQ